MWATCEHTVERSRSLQAANLASSLYQLVQQYGEHSVGVAAVKHLPRCDGNGNWHCHNPHSSLQHKPVEEARKHDAWRWTNV
jgi:hypothetical protein